MSNIGNIISGFRSFVLDQALIVDDSKCSRINSIANKFLIPLTVLLAKGTMHKFQIDADHKVQELELNNNEFNSTIAKVLVVFSTVIAVALKIFNYCISTDARKHVALIRDNKEQEKIFSQEIQEIFGGISNIMNIPYDQCTLLNAYIDLKELCMNLIHRFDNKNQNKVIRGCCSNDDQKYHFLAFKYTLFSDNKQSSTDPSKLEPSLRIHFYIKESNGDWRSLSYNQEHNASEEMNMDFDNYIFNKILTEGHSHFMTDNGVPLPITLPGNVFKFYLGHVTWEEATQTEG